VERHTTMAIALCLTVALAGCGKSDRQRDRERIASEAEQQAIADSLAQEREKDRQMRAAAAVEANKEVARAVGGTEARLAPPSATVAQSAVERQAAEGGDPLRKYMERLEQSVSDPEALQVRSAAIAPKKNAMCAEFSARDKAGVYAGFKRVIVTDVTVIPEEPPFKETLTKFLAFQAAARDSGCFPDVLDVRAIR